MFSKAERKEVESIESYNFGESIGIQGYIQWSKAFSFNMLHLLEGPAHGLSASQMKKLAENILEIVKAGPESIDDVPIHEYFQRLEEELEPYFAKKVLLMPPKRILDQWLALAEMSLAGIELIKVAHSVPGSEGKLPSVLTEAEPYLSRLDGIFNTIFIQIKGFTRKLLAHDYDVKKVKQSAEAVEKEIQRLFPTDGSLYPF